MRSVFVATALAASVSLFAAAAKADTSCSPHDNSARILARPAPNKLHRDWRGSNFVGTGWSFIPKSGVSNVTGVYLRGDLRGSRGGVVNRKVYILLREWTCDGRCRMAWWLLRPQRLNRLPITAAFAGANRGPRSGGERGHRGPRAGRPGHHRNRQGTASAGRRHQQLDLADQAR